MNLILQRIRTGSVLVAVLLIACCSLRDAAADELDFEGQIRPLLIAKCGECHGPAAQKSGLRLDARHAAFKGGDGGPVIIVGQSADSELLRRITSADSDERMPPPDAASLSAAEIGLIRQWIDSGADWPETDYDRDAARDPRLAHWAFQPLRTVAPPAIETNANGDKRTFNAIDRFVIAALREQGLSLSPEADRRTQLRRLSYDLHGLPPSPSEITQFVRNSDPDAWQQLVEKMLDSPRYGERWAQHWLDVVRYADTHGFEVNTPRENAWPYRDYVISAFNSDKPYDDFIREQLAGDLLGADAATGFLVAAAVLLPGQIGKDEESIRLARQDALDEIIVGTSGTFLGLTIGCARCHDHKFDPVTARDYYAMQAFFAGVDYGDRAISDDSRQQNLKEAAALLPEIERLQQRLTAFEPLAFGGQTLLIDEEEKSTRVTFLKKENGPGANPPGTQRGFKDDPGDADRYGNLSGGQYTWWNNTPGEDVMTWNPGVAGRFQLWLSWGVHGSGVHTRDARYVLDRDGNLETREDQQEIASVDQYYHAGVTEGETLQSPQWSGLQHAGIVELSEASRLILRGGSTGTGITADVIILQETMAESDAAPPSRSLPRLRAAVSPLENIESFDAVEAKFLRLTTFETIDDNRHQPCIDELEVFATDDPSLNIALAANGGIPDSSGNYSETGIHQLKHVNDGLYGNSHSWISNEYGGGWVQIEFPRLQRINRVIWSRDREGKFPDRLAVKYAISVSVDGTNWQTVATHSDRLPRGVPDDPILSRLRNSTDDKDDSERTSLASQLDGLRKRREVLETPRMIYGGVFREPDQTFVLLRGDPEQRADVIEPAIPKLFGELPSTDASAETRIGDGDRRLALANWVASPENPLTARVMVNRIWQYHFGRGLVDTSSDFGLNAASPSHPELLDWLAREFIESGWSVRHIHRLILNSATYRQGNRIDPAAVRQDRDNRLLWRFPSRRLEGEAVRDSILAISGELNLQMGGPGFDFFMSRGGLSGFPPVEDFRSEHLRRMIYAHRIRMERVPVFGAFDCPDAGQATPSRSRSTTAIQALNLFNSNFVMDRAQEFANRIAESATEPEDQIDAAFVYALGRTPTAVEAGASTSVVREHGLAMLCRALFNSNEFLFIP